MCLQEISSLSSAHVNSAENIQTILDRQYCTDSYVNEEASKGGSKESIL